MNAKIIIGQIDLSFHKVAAGVFHNVLEYLGYEVEFITQPHEKIYPIQQKGEIDLLISAWLPGSHGKYLAPYESDVIKFDTIYSPYCIWGVPDYVDSSITKIEDLATDFVSQKFDKDINGIGMGAGISRFSVEIIEQYSLSQFGFNFISNQPDAFYEMVEQKIIKKEWFVIPLWHPQFLNSIFNIRPLLDSKGLLRGVDNATPILLKSSKNKLSESHLTTISKIKLGNDAVSKMDFYFNKEKLSPKDASLKWINDNFTSVEKYIEHINLS